MLKLLLLVVMLHFQLVLLSVELLLVLVLDFSLFEVKDFELLVRHGDLPLVFSLHVVVLLLQVRQLLFVAGELIRLQLDLLLELADHVFEVGPLLLQLLLKELLLVLAAFVADDGLGELLLQEEDLLS